jgi:hypothetical protein
MVKPLAVIIASILILVGVAVIYVRVEADLRQGDLTSGNPQVHKAN